MLSIHPEVQDFGDEDETNYETDEINKENMNEFCIFIADQKSENTKHTIETLLVKHGKQVIIHKPPEKWERLRWTTFSLNDSMISKDK